MGQNPLAKKMLLKPGQCALLLNAPQGFPAALDPLPEGMALATVPDGQYDFVLLFVANSAELAKFLPQTFTAVKPNGILWISYPKQSAKVDTDLNRDVLWRIVEADGWSGVALVAIDAVWSAMRFRPESQVGKKSRQEKRS